MHKNILRREGRKDTGILVNSSRAKVAPGLLRDIELLASTALHVEVGEATAYPPKNAGPLAGITPMTGGLPSGH
jgi:hypothetical protein